MKKLITIMVMCSLNTLALAGNTVVIDSVLGGRKYEIDYNFITTTNAIIEVGYININKTVTAHNQGVITSEIRLCDTCDFYIRNSGTVTGQIYAGTGSEIIQIINNSNDINRIRVAGSSFSILVNNNDVVSLSDVMKISSGANKITFDNASLVMTNAYNIIPDNISTKPDPKIEVIGNVTISINNLNNMNGVLLLSNVIGDGNIKIMAPDLDKLYRADTIFKNGNVYLDVNRETDYSRLIDPTRGNFINSLRQIDPMNPTIVAMDSAASVGGIYDVANKSVMLNPIKLNDPIKMYNRFETGGAKPIIAPLISGVETNVIVGADTTMYSARGTLAYNFGDLKTSVSVYAGAFDYDDNLNEFSGNFYGGNLRAFYNDKFMWIDTTLGLTYANYKTGVIFDGKNATQNPDGISVYGVSDFGIKFDIDDEYYVSPFVGVLGEYDHVLNDSEMDYAGRAGMVAGFNSEIMGIKNDYQLFGTIQSNNVQSIGARFNFLSVVDGAGGSVSYALINNDYGINHKFAIDLTFMF
ncbi:hypothetical protein LJC18_05170 [Lachnospiraceae bacterium OttesenSCG-928-E19]|nr:hypothetical protein [Lachnospiraceae bacterium OttesenSCG-928-E19]